MSLTVALAVLGAVVLAALAAHAVVAVAPCAAAARAPSAKPAEAREPVLRRRRRRAELRAPAERRTGRRATRAALRAAAPPGAAPRRADRRHRHAHARGARSAARWRSRTCRPRAAPAASPSSIEGLNADTGEWEPPAAGPALRRVPGRRATGQPQRRAQRDRVLRVRAEGAGLRRRDRRACPTSPTCSTSVARARELDAFASEHDAQLAVHLRARSVAWSVGYIQQHAARHGFVPGMVPGRLVLPGAEEGAPPVLTLALRLAGGAGRRPATRRRCAT